MLTISSTAIFWGRGRSGPAGTSHRRRQLASVLLLLSVVKPVPAQHPFFYSRVAKSVSTSGARWSCGYITHEISFLVAVSAARPVCMYNNKTPDLRRYCIMTTLGSLNLAAQVSNAADLSNMTIRCCYEVLIAACCTSRYSFAKRRHCMSLTLAAAG
jgi:hypothetical protein